MTFQKSLSCEKWDERESNDTCHPEKILFKMFVSMIWNSSETYLAFIVYLFYIKSKRGLFGPLGSPVNIISIESMNSIRLGIILEVKGKRTKKNKIKENELSSCVEVKNQTASSKIFVKMRAKDENIKKPKRREGDKIERKTNESSIVSFEDHTTLFCSSNKMKNQKDEELKIKVTISN